MKFRELKSHVQFSSPAYIKYMILIPRIDELFHYLSRYIINSHLKLLTRKHQNGGQNNVIWRLFHLFPRFPDEHALRLGKPGTLHYAIM